MILVDTSVLIDALKGKDPKLANLFASLTVSICGVTVARGRGAGNSQPALNKERVERIGFPLAPLPEMQEIVRRFEALFRLADAIEKRTALAQQRVEKLTQAILAKAFRGELVPTEAELARQQGRDYEPAAEGR
jgi:restriction endonuclease S subunit